MEKKEGEKDHYYFLCTLWSLAFDDILFLFLQETHQRKRDILWLHLVFSKVKNQMLCVLLAVLLSWWWLYHHSVLHHRPEQEEDLNDLERPKERLSRSMIFCEDSVRFLSFSCSQRTSLLKANPGQSSRCLRRWTLWCLMTQETCLSSSRTCLVLHMREENHRTYTA